VSLLSVDSVLATLLPYRCVWCGANCSARQVCSDCCADLGWLLEACRSCGRPVPTGCPGRLCAACAGHLLPGVRVCSALRYEYPVDELVLGAKFARRPVHARVLGELLALALEEVRRAGLLGSPDLVLPVPLHRSRLAWRGFNQSDEIAAVVGARLGVPWRRDICRRVRATVEQTGLTGSQRRRNLRGAFAADPMVAGRRVAIVDDVLTTGATVAAVAAALRRAGAAGIQVWTAARAGTTVPE